ncbi:MAG: phenylalanine--tRNA ligase subunit beta [Rickettsiaceae bacterium]|nr:phenylalanine--tRNA ligase subunit beta [Rickettsiaceae bacterium]
MKFTLSWLKKFLATDATLAEILRTLNLIGLEVEDVVDRTVELKPFVVAKIIEASPHPNAEKLRICKVETAEGMLQIVCGAPNARAGIKVILAKIGTIIPNGKFQIKASEIRGVTSHGMLCSENELLIGDDHGGIAELPEDAEIGEEVARFLGLDDPVIEISVTPNRADCLGVYGIARDLAAKGIGKLVDIVETRYNFGATKSSGDSVADSALATCVIKGVKNCESPLWLQKFLRSIGQEPISAIVDITNYMCYSFARPMHAYDKSKIVGDVRVAFASGGEKFPALNDKEYILSSEDLVIKDDVAVQAIAGVIGGSTSAITKETSDIILESALFDPILVSKAGRRHYIDTDSRHRFERAVDHEYVIKGLEIAADLITEICGGEVEKVTIKGNLKKPRTKLQFDLRTVKKKTGVNIDDASAIGILKSLGFEVGQTAELLDITVPSWRHDVSIKEDIVEEIIRIYGYDNIVSVPLPDCGQSRILSQMQRRCFDSRRLLAARGYDEVVTWSFMNSKKVQNINLELQVKNPISSELDYMRPSIIPNLLDAIRKNIARSATNLAFFEVGPIFEPSKERTAIAAIRTCKLSEKTPHSSRGYFDEFDLKADLELLFAEVGFGLDKCAITSLSNEESALSLLYHPTRSAKITLGKNLIGYFGRINPEVLEDYDVKEDVVAFEIYVDTIPEAKLKYGYKGGFAPSIYQPVERDFAFLVDIAIPAGEMISYLKKLNKLIRNAFLFDLYQGDKIEQGKKSLAFNVILQADDRTLSEKEIVEVSNIIISEMESKFGAILRS